MGLYGSWTLGELIDAYEIIGDTSVCDGVTKLLLFGADEKKMSNKNEVFEYLIDQLRQQVNNNQCEDLAHEVQSLKNQLRDASAQIKELHEALATATGDAEGYKLIRKGEQSGCRKDDAQVTEPWIKWEGGECPVDRSQQVDVIFRDGGSAGPLGASYFRWKHIGNMDDIIRYRVVRPDCKHDWEVRTYPGSDETYDYCPLCREVRQ